MNPFALQDEARRKTGRLVALAVLAVAAVVVAAAFVFSCGLWAVVASLVEDRPVPFGSFLAKPAVVGISFLLSALVVFVGFLVKSSSLSSAESLMKSVGARRVFRSKLHGSDDDTLGRLRLFNVCEEMAIASGADMPSIWVLEGRPEINAFVAGLSPDESALCVTEGAIRLLERDELQGIVAHEFSHMLNGDMRLNFRLLLLIAGVTAYNRLGRGMLGMFFSHSDTDESGRPTVRIPSGGKGGKGGGCGVLILVYIAIALLLWLVGSVGVFFARLLQCAVSRQRELLADASAAQFTRNPEALANALRLTYLAGGFARTAFDVWRADVAHMLFTEGDRKLFATHPPVRERICRLSSRGLAADGALKARVARIRADRQARVAEVQANIARGRRNDPSPADAFPPAFVARLREEQGAGAILVQLLRGRIPDGLAAMPSRAQKRQLAKRCAIAIRDAGSPAARTKWVETVEAIAKEDGEIDSFEFLLIAAMRRYLRPARAIKTQSAARLLTPCAKVISTIASFGAAPADGYRAAEAKLSLIPTPLPPMPPPHDDAMAFLDDLAALEALAPLAKREFLFALQATAAQDGVVSDEEADYIAAAADAIGAFGWNRGA